jgi:uncharacterized membrane protein
MRSAMILAFAANLLLVVVYFTVLPDRVAIHFGSGGVPDQWASSHFNAILMTIMNIIVFVPLFFFSKLLCFLPKEYVSIPNKKFWIQEKNWRLAVSILDHEMKSFGTAVFVFLFVLGGFALEANLATPVRLREELFWWPFGLFLGYTGYWTWRLILRFKRHEKELG